MSRKKKPSLFVVFWEVFANSLLQLIITLIPAAIQIYQFYGGTVKMLENIPSWIWFAPLIVYIAFVVVRSFYLYRKKLNDYNSSKQQSHRTKRKINRADSGVAIQDSPYSQVTSNSHNSNINQITNNGDFLTSGRDTIKIVNPPAEKPKPPNILLSIGDNGHFSTTKTIRLKPLPSKPNFESLLLAKKVELQQKFETFQQSSANKNKYNNEIDVIVESLELLENQNRRIKSQEEYSKDIGEYLLQYREYLSKIYDASIILDRYHDIKLVLENQGETPATSVIVEIHLPDNIFVSSRLQRIRKEVEFKNMMGRGSYEPIKPKEPDFFVIEEEGLSHVLNTDMYSVDTHARNPNNFEVEKRNGIPIVVYKIPNLIHNRPFIDLFPFPVWLSGVTESITLRIPVKIYAAELLKTTESYIELNFIVV